MPNPLDMLLRSHATLALIEAGFSKKSRQYRLTNDNGDLVALAFPTSQAARPNEVAFFLEFGLIPAAYRDWRESTDPEISLDSYAWGLIRYRFRVPAHVSPPHAWGLTDRWQFTPETDGGVGATALESVLRTEVIPLLQRLLEPAGALDAADNPKERRWHPSWWLRFCVLLDQGPSADLDDAWKPLAYNSFGREVTAWAAQRLLVRYGVDESWHERVERAPSTDPVKAQAMLLIDVYLVPALVAVGFRSTGGAFRRSNDWGDELIVEIAPAYSTTEGTVLLRMDAGIMPIMEWEYRGDWARQSGGSASARRPVKVLDSWFRTRVAPPEEFADLQPDREVLGLRLWSIPFPNLARGGRAMTTVLESNLKVWLRLLDRDNLLQLATDRTLGYEDRLGLPSFTHADLVLNIDRVEPEVITTKINTALQDSISRTTDDRVIEWSRKRINGFGNNESGDF